MPSSVSCMFETAARAGRTLAHGLLHLLFPNTCWTCGVFLRAEETGFCLSCRTALTTDSRPACPRCAATIGPFVPVEGGCHRCRNESFAFDQVLRLGPYEGLLRETVLRLKHAPSEGLAEVLGRLWTEHLEERLKAAKADVVIPVPLHWRRRMSRGYNQSQALAGALGRRLGLPCRPRWLRRVRFTESQKQQTPTARRENLRGAFRARSGLNLRGQSILLIDDVMTTGSTANEAARALRVCKPERIIVAVLARGGLGLPQS